MAAGSLTTAIVPRMVGPTRIGHSKCALVQVSMGFRRKTRIVAKGPSGASSGRGAGGRGSSMRRSVMTLIPINGVAALKAGRLDTEPVSPKNAALRECLARLHGQVGAHELAAPPDAL